MNTTEALANPVPERAEPIDVGTMDFEEELLKILLNTTRFPEGLKSYPNAKRSFGDVAKQTIMGDIRQLGMGYAIVFVYVIFMLGKLDCVEQRVFLSFAGILSVIFGMTVAYGLCSAAGLFFTPMHNILPFLLLGIGIDDMFVIARCFDTLSPADGKLPLPIRFGAVNLLSFLSTLLFALQARPWNTRA